MLRIAPNVATNLHITSPGANLATYLSWEEIVCRQDPLTASVNVIRSLLQYCCPASRDLRNKQCRFRMRVVCQVATCQTISVLLPVTGSLKLPGKTRLFEAEIPCCRDSIVASCCPHSILQRFCKLNN